MKKTVLTNFLVVLLTLISLHVMSQGTTTATMSGRISGSDGGTLPGATILATDLPSGTQYGTTTDANGYYRIANMNVGGPYRLVISYVGYETLTKDNVYLSLGQTFKMDIILSTKDVSIGGVEVLALKNDIFDGNRTGAETTVTLQSIEALPTVGRNFSDYTRLTPQAKVDQYGGVQIAGTNNRYNSIYIDGAVNNDVFGLTSQGTNGGQTGISPFSMDILDQISIQVAPYDVKLGGFSGAGINAVTRRGTNEFSGSAYYITRNESLAGLTPTNDETLERTQLADFSSNTYGFRAGGPLVKDKLFFFINAEIQQDETPQPFDFTTYNGSATEAELDALADKLRGMGYEPGGYKDKIATLNGVKFFGRIDWNINKIHRLMVRHQYTNAEQYSPATSSTTAIRFANAGIYFPSTTNTTAIELKSNLSSTTSNNLILGFTSVRDDRNPMGGNFPYVRIKDGSSNIYFGSEEFSTANRLYQDIITLTDNYEIYKGKHTITLGTHNEFYSMYNLFVRQNFGSYQFADLATFMNDGAAYQYDRTFSAVDAITGDGSAAAADFNALQIGVYAQDEIQVSDKLKVTAGLRLDVPMFLSTPRENTDFNENVIPMLEDAGWDLEGAKTGQTPDPSLMVNPRIGFNYDVFGDKSLQIRGGAGIFTSRIPYVWPGASFQNNAVLTGGMKITAEGSPELLFNPDWNAQPSVLPLTQPSGQVDIFAKDFKFPQVFRASLAADKKLPYGIVASFEGIFTKNISNVMYYNLRYVQDGTLTGTPDNRPIYRKLDLGVDPTTGKNRAYTDIIFGTNTNEGYGYTLTAQLQKNFDNGLTTSLAYTYGDAYSMNDGVSSQNSSQWRVVNVRGKNDLDMAKSDFAMGHRIVGFVNYKKEYLKSMATSISLFYNGQSGDLYSYGYADGSTKYLGEDNQSLELMYIPSTASDIHLVDMTDADGNVTSATDQWTALNAFIDADEYLSANRGSYAVRNGARVPFVNLFDLRIAQDFYVKVGGKKNTIQIALDVFNLGNLLNKDWGRIYYASGAYYSNYPLVKFAGFEADGTTPTYTFTAPKSTVWAIDDSGLQSSRWQGQLTLRYIFN